ncbi:saccharopine dehydrogenase [Actinomadura sp. KC06]|uniref:saccharopine dehydrogenase C-terminal domain-containing protein n=1 Tax=Actinomadura sp. KC06 TaxID=2530369 RepID=UPI0010479296|nr:saccharopine dehydrogenase C-terminal domain-containing protein [Actinomadura sp. KC06]TDD34953.1 saccharopine dehydrogenase [Actinomadura sp. KC06]
MPEKPSGTVHWVGTGLSTGPSGLREVAAAADRLLLWGRDRDRARARRDLAGIAEPRGLDSGDLPAELRPGDVLVSMLPAAEHPRLLKLCLDAGAHFVCSSYVTDELAAMAAGAEDLVVLCEAGLDPGIDHLAAHLLVERGREVAGDRARSAEFTSYCGGIPAVPNEFRYRFSWAPRGVLAALEAPARHRVDGADTVVERPWEAVRSWDVGGEEFEVYPNRDSIPFIARYGLPEGWPLRTFVRGTLRHAGWAAAWKPVFDTLRVGDPATTARLATELARRHPTGPGDLDRVVLAVDLAIERADGVAWRGGYLLDVTGDPAESAMARCVSLPVACGVLRVLSGAMPTGLRIAAADAAEADHWLDFLRGRGLEPRYTEI